MALARSILVTGGAGYVGSHFVRSALDRGSSVVVLDDLSNATAPVERANMRFVKGDIADTALVQRLVKDHEIDGVVHFAGLIQVGESVAKPAEYFATNLVKTLRLLDALRAGGPSVFVFSSTAAVYGSLPDGPIVEGSATAPSSPYGMSKLAVEYALASYGHAYGLRWAALRYFNAAGAHPDGTHREEHEPETHLIPLAIDAALGARGPLTVFGDDYQTADGTCVRDYVHVCDLADAHLRALDRLLDGVPVGATNLGSGQGSSVRQVLSAVEARVGRAVPCSVGQRRAGDPPQLVASIARAKEILGWQPQRSLAQIIDDAVRSRSR